MIPATWRRTLGIAVGDDLILVLEAEGLRVLTSAQAVARAQGFVRAGFGRAGVVRGRALSRELIDERRADAKRE